MSIVIILKNVQAVFRVVDDQDDLIVSNIIQLPVSASSGAYHREFREVRGLRIVDIS
jgi:hypothetical protein